MTARFLVGDVFERMAELPDHSFDLIVTSPPFLALRSYLPEGHPQKDLEIGSEPTPAAFLDTLLALTAEWRRLLAPHGSIAVELGDTYAGSGGAGGDYDRGGMRDGQERWVGSAAWARSDSTAQRHPSGHGLGWPLDKSLCGIPTLYAWSLAYGRNLLRQPLTARELFEQAEQLYANDPKIPVIQLLGELSVFLAEHEERGPSIEIEPWRVRNLKPWIRSNPPVGALGDKERPATSYITVACVSDRRWFDLDAVRTPTGLPESPAGNMGYDEHRAERGRNGIAPKPVGGGIANPGGAPPLDWWHPIDAIIDHELDQRAGKTPRGGTKFHTHHNIKDQPGLSIGNHAAGPESVGARGVHIRRRLEAAGYLHTQDAYDVSPRGYAGAHYAVWPPELVKLLISEMCPAGGRVLDPFVGSGTTLAVASGMGRDSVGIDLDERNAVLAEKRVGMFLDVDWGTHAPTTELPPDEVVAQIGDVL